MEPEREYSESFGITRSRKTQISSGFTPLRIQQNSFQDSPFFTIPGAFKEKTRIKGKEQDFFQPKAEIIRPNNPEAVGLGERSAQKQEIIVNTPARISKPTIRNDIPPQNEHSVVTPDSKTNINEL
ncbi:hypothetical protein O181_099615 [Austropuccinia psidii MF-1]|uniref:Uncharacterized protein n=1 Tax=Austropuccinia psidii MF-1 TaxID=1389203 RepID=A0A9Q3JDZ1_9BASI|nr:hypothetical protein [Austropuccinia psidii MF-1]